MPSGSVSSRSSRSVPSQRSVANSSSTPRIRSDSATFGQGDQGQGTKTTLLSRPGPDSTWRQSVDLAAGIKTYAGSGKDPAYSPEYMPRTGTGKPKGLRFLTTSRKDYVEYGPDILMKAFGEAEHLRAKGAFYDEAYGTKRDEGGTDVRHRYPVREGYNRQGIKNESLRYGSEAASMAWDAARGRFNQKSDGALTPRGSTPRGTSRGTPTPRGVEDQAGSMAQVTPRKQDSVASAGKMSQPSSISLGSDLPDHRIRRPSIPPNISKGLQGPAPDPQKVETKGFNLTYSAADLTTHQKPALSPAPGKAFSDEWRRLGCSASKAEYIAHSVKTSKLMNPEVFDPSVITTYPSTLREACFNDGSGTTGRRAKRTTTAQDSYLPPSRAALETIQVVPKMDHVHELIQQPLHLNVPPSDLDKVMPTTAEPFVCQAW